jgi:outer membrane protein assembly factor BamB
MRSCLPFLVVLGLTGADWPQWLGPTRDGVSTEKVTPWPKEPKKLWSIDAGEGHSSPVVAGDKVFLHLRRSLGKAFGEFVAAYDAGSGKLIWEQQCGDSTGFHSVFGNGPRATPSVVDGKVYALGVTGMLSCLSATDGKVLWQVDILKTFGAANLFFGVSGSPLVEGEKVLLNVGAQGASVVAFDRKTGEVAWKSGDDPASYSSGVTVDLAGQRQAVFLTGKGVVALDPANGHRLWDYPFTDKLNESSSTPIKVDGRLLVSTIMSGSVALEVTKMADVPSVKEVWKDPNLTCYFSTPLPVGKEHVYLVTGSSNPLNAVATLHCADVKSGKVLWSRPKVGKYHAALIRTGDDKLLMLQDSGMLVLLEPNGKEYKELARAKVCGLAWAHPALAGGRLYVRDDKQLICLEMSNQP